MLSIARLIKSRDQDFERRRSEEEAEEEEEEEVEKEEDFGEEQERGGESGGGRGASAVSYQLPRRGAARGPGQEGLSRRGK